MERCGELRMPGKEEAGSLQGAEVSQEAFQRLPYQTISVMEYLAKKNKAGEYACMQMKEEAASDNTVHTDSRSR